MKQESTFLLWVFVKIADLDLQTIVGCANVGHCHGIDSYGPCLGL